MSETQGWQFRLAGSEDAESFTLWTLSNPQIEPKDIDAAQKKNNPTVVYFAAENAEGKVVAFAPVYMQMILAHLVFNPESTNDDRKQAMEGMLNVGVHYALELGVREIVVMSKEEYGVAKWAVRQGFELDPRQLFKLDLNKLVAATKE
jgi:hypothetical protein